MVAPPERVPVSPSGDGTVSLAIALIYTARGDILRAGGTHCVASPFTRLSLPHTDRRIGRAVRPAHYLDEDRHVVGQEGFSAHYG